VFAFGLMHIQVHGDAQAGAGSPAWLLG